jgi:hypothetical protein
MKHLLTGLGVGFGFYFGQTIGQIVFALMLQVFL